MGWCLEQQSTKLLFYLTIKNRACRSSESAQSAKRPSATDSGENGRRDDAGSRSHESARAAVCVYRSLRPGGVQVASAATQTTGRIATPSRTGGGLEKVSLKAIPTNKTLANRGWCFINTNAVDTNKAKQNLQHSIDNINISQKRCRH